MKTRVGSSLILLGLVFSLNCYSQKDAQVNPTIYKELTYKPLKTNAIIIPMAFVVYGFSSPQVRQLHNLDVNTHTELQEDFPSFSFKGDDYLRYVPIAAVYGLDLAGVNSKHNFTDRTAMLLISTAMMGATTDLTKGATNRLRPNGANDHSFPSGHTAMAFMAAEFMHQEYKDESVWYTVIGYSAAIATGGLRLYNGAHWFSDVVAGAGYGILSTKITYWAYPFVKEKLFKGKSNNTVLVPMHQNGLTGFTYIRKF
ncbi:phosphatase PAP2 family protein [Pedobacter immunditicola]|uniref:phosphatase PAP2 family protein n=1 Tax=Pedobacter immunditicola TaxID=3133440 RepID=UPI003098E589